MGATNTKWNKAQLFMVISIALATFMTTLDASIVSIAVPTITKELHTTAGMVSWIIIVYGLLLSSLLLTFGKLADILGFKKLFLIGLIIFTAGSVLSGISTDIDMLIAVRGLQGVGASILAALTLAMVSLYLPEESKGKGLGVVSTFLALGIALGPVIGGFLTEYLSWRWIFFINAPVCLIAIFMGLRYIPADQVSKVSMKGFDILGAVLFFGCVFTFLLAINMGNSEGWTSVFIISMLSAAVVLLLLFLFNERRAKSPMLNKHITKNRNILAENFSGLAIMGAMGGAFILMPFYFEILQHQSTSQTGLLMLSASGAVMVFGLLAGKMSDKIGSRKLCIAGGLLSALSFTILATIGPTTAIPIVLVGLFVLGMGFGTYLSPASNLILRQTPKEFEGVSTGFINTTRNLGYIVGLTIMVSVFEMIVPSMSHATPEVIASGFQTAFYVGIALSLICTGLAFVAKDAPAVKQEEGNAASKTKSGSA
jgi:EmrB/QacA subfamily drug resistance transporter